MNPEEIARGEELQDGGDDQEQNRNAQVAGNVQGAGDAQRMQPMPDVGNPNGGNAQVAGDAQRMQPMPDVENPNGGNAQVAGNVQGVEEAPNEGNAQGAGNAQVAGEAPGDAAAAQRAADIERLRAALADAEAAAAEADKKAEEMEEEAMAAKKRQKKAEKKMEKLRKPARAAAKTAGAAAKEVATAKEVARGEAALNAIAAAEAAESTTKAAFLKREKVIAEADAARARADVAKKEAEAAEEARKNAGEEAKADAEEEARRKAYAAAAAEAAAVAAANAIPAAVEEAKKVEEEEIPKVSAAKCEEKIAIAELEGAIAAVPAAIEAAETTAETANKTQKPVADAAEAAANAEKEHNDASTAAEAAKKTAEKAKERAEKIKEELKNAKKGDAYSVDFLNMVANADGEGAVQENKPDENRAFDTLDDLKNLAQAANQVEQDNLAEDPKNSELKELRQDVMQLRKGNLYKAVIMSKNPQAAAEEQKRAPGRFSRFMNSSMIKAVGKFIDIGGDFSKTVNAASGIGGAISDDYKNSGAFGIIGLINDGMVLLGSIKKIIKDVQAIKDIIKNDATTEKKVLTLISLATNSSMIIAKLASIGKFISDKAGSDKWKDRCEAIKNGATLISQTGTLASGGNSLRKLLAKKSKLKDDQKEEGKEVGSILGKIENNNAENDNAANNNENNEEGDKKDQAEEGKKDEVEEGKKDQAEEDKKDQAEKGKKNQADQKKNKRLGADADKELKEKVEKVRGTAWAANPNLNDEEKTTLASYFARERAIDKNETALVDAYIGLATTLLGMGSTISTMVDNKVGNKGSGIAKKIFTIASGSAVIGNTALKPVAKKFKAKKEEKKEEKKEQETGEKTQIKNTLWGAVQSLQGDEYGLRRITADLAHNDEKPPEGGKIANAQKAVTRYRTVAKQLDSSVDYDELFAAKNEEEFKNALVAGI